MAIVGNCFHSYNSDILGGNGGGSSSPDTTSVTFIFLGSSPYEKQRRQSAIIIHTLFKVLYFLNYLCHKHFLYQKPVFDSQSASKLQQPPSMLVVLCGSSASCHTLQ